MTYFKLFGRWFQVAAIYFNVDLANRYMEATQCKVGVLDYNTNTGRIILARMDDKGVNECPQSNLMN